MRLTAEICMARAGCFEEAAEHLNLAWDTESAQRGQVPWVYAYLMRLVNKWEAKADELTESAKDCES